MRCGLRKMTSFAPDRSEDNLAVFHRQTVKPQKIYCKIPEFGLQRREPQLN